MPLKSINQSYNSIKSGASAFVGGKRISFADHNYKIVNSILSCVKLILSIAFNDKWNYLELYST